jgi:protein-disulfide isomerase
VHYNVGVSKAGISGHFVLALIMAPLLMGGACEKKEPKPNDTGAIAAADHAAVEKGPTDTAPLRGVDVSKLDADQQTLFYKLISTLTSPCGKAQSLRASFTSDQTCKRAPFAVKYVEMLVEDQSPEDETKKLYDQKYNPAPVPPVKFDLSKEPHIGPEDAPIRWVEFYDYGCPHCEEFKPYFEQMLQDEKGKVVAYFMHYTLGGFPQSHDAAQAALAAFAQGKWKEMHDKLYEHRTEHSREQLEGYAKELGLDMAKFDKDFDAVAAHVDAQHQQGENAGVKSTPTLFINERHYEGPYVPKYMDLWVEEELAVNR